MPKGQQKGNREVRKAKSDKTKPPAGQDASFAVRSGLTPAPKSGKSGKSKPR